MTRPDAVQHFVSVEPEQPISRARVVTGSRTDEVALFVRDQLVGRLDVPAGMAADVCAQLRLIDRRMLSVSLDTIKREFSRAMTGE